MALLLCPDPAKIRPEYRPTARAEHCYELLRAAYIRDQVEKAGVPDVKAVASYFRRFLTVIGIRQRYPGHARQAGLVASQCQGAAYLGRYVVVVDDDIDAYDINDVLWAMCSRADPVDATEILRRCWSGPLDPIIPRERKGFSSRMIIDACRPFEWRDKFPTRRRDRRRAAAVTAKKMAERTIQLMRRSDSPRRRAVANVFATMGRIHQITDAKKKRPDFWGSGLLPLSVTGGSVAAAVPWELC